ncbi:MBL fold metallo-hydrolase [Paenibacillus sp. ACRRX]|uniref:MBL fold metallo-hydrolase n=1 Tax=Paenibacillus sp. ACRRX TaxID=2918206 RepID=UPI001EF5073B|nr:MBL fold metallo-hydrolase [Paenibacillus sp. ACRRX]MCG7406919.1 MBL fold metallo-hydrolase [Paenibacillus sp. ACRRX]
MSNYVVLNIEFEYQGQQQVISPVLIQDAADTILVDCGYPDFLPKIEEAANRHHISVASITKLILTHHDMDHMGSLAALKRAYPQLTVIAHELEAPYIAGQRKSLRLEQVESTWGELRAEDKPHVEQLMLLLQSNEPAAVDQTVRHQERLPLCSGIEIIHTPGHMPGHMSLYLPASKTLIAGDAVVIQEGGLAIANPEFTLDLEEAVRSVRRLLDYNIEHLICYHGGLYQGNVKQALRALLQAYDS